MAILFQGTTAWQCLTGSTDRQIEPSHNYLSRYHNLKRKDNYFNHLWRNTYVYWSTNCGTR